MIRKVSGILIVLFACCSFFGKPAKANAYEVKKGDTLTTVSEKFDVPEASIVNHNHLMSTVLKAGQYLDIPEKSSFKKTEIPPVTLQLGISLPELLIGPVPVVQSLPAAAMKRQPPEEMVYMADSGKKRIALTFDDGPDKTYTPEILEILKEKGVKATFFVVGQQAKMYPEQLKKIHTEGHVIGNHTWDHPHLPKLTEKQWKENIQKTDKVIEKITGFRPELFRPPFGEIEDQQVASLNKQGYRLIMWSADTKDWKGISAEKIVTKVKENAMPGVIVLQHNYHASGKFETVEALPKIIDELRADGYEFVTVPTLLKN